jgi:hypothetical protein
MKTKIFLLIFLSLLNASAVAILYWTTSASLFKQNSFGRIFADDLLTGEHIVDLLYNSYYVAGYTDNKIYLANEIAPMHLLIVDDRHSRPVTISNLENYRIKSSKITIDSPYFYVADLITYTLFRGTLNDWNITQPIYERDFFAEAVTVSNNSIAMRTFDSTRTRYVLIKESRRPASVKQGEGLLERQVDGLFCTDGMLHYDHDLRWLVYVYFYRNQFLCMDTSLNLLYRGNTIDTITRAQIKVARIESENSITLAAPPLIVNRRSYVSGRWLFVNSPRAARNENFEEFNNSSVMDMYDLKEGAYKLSFYLPNYDNHAMRHFAVFGNILIALTDRYLLIYQINSKYL